MKILHVITSLRTGGAEHLMVDLLPRLRDMGNEVELLLFDGTRTPFYEQLEARNIPIHSLAVGGNVYDPRNIFRLHKYFKRYDIIHTHNTACQLYAAVNKVLCSAVLVTTEHNTSNRRRDWKWYAPIDRWMYRQYKAIICISDQAEENLRKVFRHDGNRIITIYNGVDIKQFVNARPASDIVNSFAKKNKIAMVAGFRYQKDQATLIKAMKYLSENYCLLLIGTGEKQAECERLAQDIRVCDRVHFMGLRTDVAAALKAADVVVLSSHFEGLSLSSIEGMASGKPFIASDVDGLREVVDGAGVLFPHGDHAALAQAIKEHCENPDLYKQVAQRCQERAKQYDISVMAENYNKLYQNLFG